MTRSGVFACVVICGAFATCRSGPPSPSGIPVFAEGRVSMTFTPQDQTFAEAAEAYRRLWVDEGSKIIEAMERGTGLTYFLPSRSLRENVAVVDREHRCELPSAVRRSRNTGSFVRLFQRRTGLKAAKRLK